MIVSAESVCLAQTITTGQAMARERSYLYNKLTTKFSFVPKVCFVMTIKQLREFTSKALEL